MEIGILRPGHRIKTMEGRQAEVLEQLPEDVAVRAVYLDEAGGPFGSSRRTAEEALLGVDDVEALLGAVPPTVWREAVTIVLHYVTESPEGLAEYRAETLSGVPNDVVVSGGSPVSSRDALDHLLGGLSLMGFSGTAIVEDNSSSARNKYEVEVPYVQ